MATITTIKCDICGSSEKVKQGTWFPVVWTSEQTEGRSTKPYLQVDKKDVCEACLDKVCAAYPLRATGAQGYADYTWKE